MTVEAQARAEALLAKISARVESVARPFVEAGEAVEVHVRISGEDKRQRYEVRALRQIEPSR